MNIPAVDDAIERAKYYERILDAVNSGYGGMLPNGNIVDRREHPEAMPIQKNTLLGAPEPKPVERDGTDRAAEPARVGHDGGHE